MTRIGSTVYTQHPVGYPQTVYAVQGSGRRWYITRDEWATATSHTGAVRIGGVYRSKRAAEIAAKAIGEEQE